MVAAEQCIMKMRAKIYRFRDNQWKERGVGNAKLMRNNISKRISFLLRQDKTMKPVANFIISTEDPLCNLQASPGMPEKAFVLQAMDFSDSEEGSIEMLTIRLQNEDKAAEFSKAFNIAKHFNATAKKNVFSELIWATPVEDEEEGAVDDIDSNRFATTAADEDD